MPNIKSAKKRMKTAAKAHDRNAGVKSAIAKARRRLLEAIQAEDRKEAERLFAAYCSTVDKAAKRGIIKANNASRRKARASAHLAALPA